MSEQRPGGPGAADDAPVLPTTPGARVTVLSRRECHLCEVAEEVVREVCAELGERYSVVWIDDDAVDPRLQRRHTDEVPVTFVDGRQHDFWRVDPDRLRAALRR